MRLELSEQRLLNLLAGVKRFERWLADQMLHGIAGLETDPTVRLEAIATQLTDDQLPGPAEELRSWKGRLGYDSGWLKEFVATLGYWHLLTQLAQKQTGLTPGQRDAVWQCFGARVRKAKVLESFAYPMAHWTCVGEQSSERANVHTRKLYWAGPTREHWAVQVDSNYGVPPQATSNSIGEGGQMALHAYPGGLPGRVAPPAGYTVERSARLPACASDWLALASDHEALLASQPWRRELPVRIDGLMVRVAREHIHLIDRRGRMVKLRAEGDSARVWNLVSLAGLRETAIFAVKKRTGIQLLSAWACGRLYKL